MSEHRVDGVKIHGNTFKGTGGLLWANRAADDGATDPSRYRWDFQNSKGDLITITTSVNKEPVITGMGRDWNCVRRVTLTRNTEDPAEEW